MGMFSKLLDSLKDGAADLKKDETFKSLEQAAQQMAEKVSKVMADNAPNAAPKKPEPARTEKPAVDEPESDSGYPVYDTGDEYFEKIVREENFPGYTIEKGVHPRIMDGGAHPACMPVTYLFRRDGKPVLAVFVMQYNQYRAMIAKGSYQILEANGIPYIRFFKGFRNEEAYVINRIKENLH